MMARLVRLWWRAWPVWLCLGWLGVMLIFGVVGGLPVLAPYRIDTLALFYGSVVLVLLGGPLLLAWAIWSVFRLRNRWGRAVIFLVLLVLGTAVFGFLVVNFFKPQM
jgi:hypothetical protein